MNWLKKTIKRALQWLEFLPATNDKLYEGLHIGPNTYYTRLITLGQDCVLAPTAMILTHDASSVIHTGKNRFAPVKIGDRCFLGYNSVIMPGVTVGDDVIVGAGAVVTSDVPAGAVVGGVPARVIGNTADVMKKWENQLVEPPYAFGVYPTQHHLLEIQERALTRYGHENRSGTNP